MSEWELIETLPEKEVRVLMTCSTVKDCIFIGRYVFKSSIFSAKCRWFIVDDTNTVRQKNVNIYPTHWQPLPKQVGVK